MINAQLSWINHKNAIIFIFAAQGRSALKNG
jgi:hypothetical protein